MATFPWETKKARRARAAAICAQCAAEHQVDDLICYCQLDACHRGDHVDHMGRRFAQFFSSTGAYARDMARRAENKMAA